MIKEHKLAGQWSLEDAVRESAVRELEYLNRGEISLAAALSEDKTLYKHIQRDCILYQMIQTSLLYGDKKRAVRLFILLHHFAGSTRQAAEECLEILLKKVEKE